MTDQTGTPSSPEPPKLRRRLVTAAPAAAPKVKFVSPAAEGVEVVKPRFLTPELQAKLAQDVEIQDSSYRLSKALYLLN